MKRRLFLRITLCLSFLFREILQNPAFSFETPDSYIKSYIGSEMRTSEIFAQEDGIFLQKSEEISIRVINYPDEYILNYFMARILGLASELGIKVVPERPELGIIASEVLIFDDFFTETQRLNVENFKKYGVNTDNYKINSKEIMDRKCFAIREVKNGKIIRVLNFIDRNLNSNKLRKCVISNAMFSFGIIFKIPVGPDDHEADQYWSFIEQFSPFILKRRSYCLKISAEYLNYECLKQ